MDLTSQFRSWLVSRRYSSSTVKNYIADLGKYLSFVSRLTSENTPVVIFSTSLISQYILSLRGKNNSQRYLASLSLFCQFAADQHLVSANPFPIALNSIANPDSVPQVEISNLIDLFRSYLVKNQISPITIKNYISDLHQYIYWFNSHHSES